jgi:hypothetical protein
MKILKTEINENLNLRSLSLMSDSFAQLENKETKTQRHLRFSVGKCTCSRAIVSRGKESLNN